MVEKAKVNEMRSVHSSHQGKSTMILEFLKRFKDLASIFGIAFCISIVFYAGSVYNRVNTIEHSVDKIENMLGNHKNDVKHSVEKIEKMINDHIISIDRRLDKFETRLDKFETRLDKFETKLDEIKDKLREKS